MLIVNITNARVSTSFGATTIPYDVVDVLLYPNQFMAVFRHLRAAAIV